MEKIELKKIYTKRLAYELRMLGNKIVRVEANPTKPQFDVYVFKNDERFQASYPQALVNLEARKAVTREKRLARKSAARPLKDITIE